MKLTRSQFLRNNHYTHLQVLCIAAGLWCGYMTVKDEDLSYLFGTVFVAVVGIVIEVLGRKAYNRYLRTP